MSKQAKLFCVLALFALFAASCGHDDGETETGGTAPPTEQPGTGDPDPGEGSAEPGFDDGAFGDLGVICQDGTPAPVTEETPGLSDTEVRIATVNDEGFVGRSGLNEEMLDTAQAFAEWCNGHGGINGRQIVVDHRDAKFAEFQQRVLESCAEDFFMVGGGAVLDDTGQPDRLACGLPDIAGFMVTPAAVQADLHHQPVPNPVTTLNVDDLQYFAEQFPDAITKVWSFTGALATLQTQAERFIEAGEDLGFEFVHTSEYSPAGEANWKPFAQAAKDKGAEAIFWTGEAENLVALLEAAAEIDFDPVFVRTDANHYTPALIELGGDAVDTTFTKMGFFPYERADENLATAQYLELMETFKPDGKTGLLGTQGLSAWLLFTVAANECDEAGTFTRDCIFDAAAIDGWTGGGLHSPQDVPGGTAGECNISLVPGEGTDFVTAPDFEVNDDPYHCSPDSVITLSGDYGEGITCPSGVADPKPSTCGE